VGGTPYPVSLRVLSFETLYRVRDSEYERPAAETFARCLHEQRAATLAALAESDDMIDGGNPDGMDTKAAGDLMARCEQTAVVTLRNHRDFQARILKEPGVKWGRILYMIRDTLPEELSDREQIAKTLVRPVLERLFGPKEGGWTTQSLPQENGKSSVYVRALKTADGS